MNQRIQAIADQAAGEFELMYKDIPQEFYERFAELIVKDCACVPTDMWGEGVLDVHTAVKVHRQILKDFGVEQ